MGKKGDEVDCPACLSGQLDTTVCTGETPGNELLPKELDVHMRNSKQLIAGDPLG